MESNREVPTVATATCRVDELRAIRRVLAARLDSGQLSPRDTVPIVRQLREVSKELEELEAVPVDDEQSSSTDGAAFYMAAI